MACKLVIQSSDGVELSKLKIKNPHAEHKVLSRCFFYVEDGDVKVVVRCERVAGTSAREVDD
ncbi:hypothetical protein [Lacipirellula sp.]|uniref:hypothetical protein n=1 Tax=Lacipirellula sp. TaxID=2691419 RepID=UPI003D0D1A0F